MRFNKTPALLPTAAAPRYLLLKFCSAQGLTLVHFLAEPEPAVSDIKYTPNTPYTP